MLADYPIHICLEVGFRDLDKSDRIELQAVRNTYILQFPQSDLFKPMAAQLQAFRKSISQPVFRKLSIW